MAASGNYADAGRCVAVFLEAAGFGLCTPRSWNRPLFRTPHSPPPGTAGANASKVEEVAQCFGRAISFFPRHGAARRRRKCPRELRSRHVRPSASGRPGHDGGAGARFESPGSVTRNPGESRVTRKARFSKHPGSGESDRLVRAVGAARKGGDGLPEGDHPGPTECERLAWHWRPPSPPTWPMRTPCAASA